MNDPPESPEPVVICPVCGSEAWESVADDVVRCTNCTYLWVAESSG